MARHCSFATSKVEEYRSVDLAHLRRWRMLRLGKILETGTMPAIVWNTPDGQEKLGVVAGATGVLFLKRIDGERYGLFVARPHSSAAGALGSNVLGADEAVVCSTAPIA
jgi:hypothetical protein